tara:strand:- start:930 stop:1676 length:747 start_codon:yes stop_codon:yes gene_type:complete
MLGFIVNIDALCRNVEFGSKRIFINAQKNLILSAACFNSLSTTASIIKNMEKYRKVRGVARPYPVSTDEVRISSRGSLVHYVLYGMRLLGVMTTQRSGARGRSTASSSSQLITARSPTEIISEVENSNSENFSDSEEILLCSEVPRDNSPQKTLNGTDAGSNCGDGSSASGIVDNSATDGNNAAGPEQPSIRLTGTGNCISKAIVVAEVLKRSIPNLHQVVELGITEIVDLFEPTEEGLDHVVTILTI